MIYRDKFSSGDLVTWRDDHYAKLTDGMSRYGNGPFFVTDVEDLTAGFASVGHTQIVTVNGEEYSGAFFKKATT